MERNSKGQFVKGMIPHNKGIIGIRKDSDSSKKKKSISLKKAYEEGRRISWNKDLTKETNRSVMNISLSNTGKTQSQETINKRIYKIKERISNGDLTYPNTGKTYEQIHGKEKALDILEKKRNRKYTNEMKEVNSDRLKFEYAIGIRKIWNKDMKGIKTNDKSNSGSFKKGHEVPNEWIKMFSDKKKGKHISPKTEFNKESRKYIVVPKKDSSIEIKIQNFLKQLGITFLTHQYMKDIEHGYQCDILIPSIKLVIECDGDYWHKYPIGRDIDKIRTSELLSNGFKVLRLWEKEIRKMNINTFNNKLMEIK